MASSGSKSLMLGLVRQRINRFFRRRQNAAAVDALALRGVDQAELDGHPVQTRQVHAFFLGGLQAELAVGVGEFGETTGWSAAGSDQKSRGKCPALAGSPALRGYE
jgi:hypothetical protein